MAGIFLVPVIDERYISKSKFKKGVLKLLGIKPLPKGAGMIFRLNEGLDKTVPLPLSTVTEEC